MSARASVRVSGFLEENKSPVDEERTLEEEELEEAKLLLVLRTKT
jgi:hypothetical protein